MFEHKVVITKAVKGNREVEDWLEHQFGPEGTKWQLSNAADSIFRVVYFYSERYKTMFQLAFSHYRMFNEVVEAQAWFQNRVTEMVRKESMYAPGIQSGDVL